MNYDKLIEKAMNGRSVNATAIALGIPQKTFEGYVKQRSFPSCGATILIANAAGVDLETAVKAVAKQEVLVKRKSEKVKIALDRLSVSFKTLLRGANVSWKRVSTTAQ